MNFEALDERMRRYETVHDICALPEIYLVARLDGRGFTRLTKERHQFDAPYDERFRNLMADTASHLMQCGFNMVYGYSQSDEISLLLHPEDQTFGRKLRKLNSVLAGEASAKFSLLLNGMATFDCRISELPTRRLVMDYFLWRQGDAVRNCLNAHCYWLLRRKGESAGGATQRLCGMSFRHKHDLLFEHGLNFNGLPSWQKRGIGVYRKDVPKSGIDPRTGLATSTVRRVLHVDFDLPIKTAYETFVVRFIDTAETQMPKTVDKETHYGNLRAHSPETLPSESGND